MSNPDIEFDVDRKSPTMQPETRPDIDKGASEEVENVTIILTEEDVCTFLQHPWKRNSLILRLE